MANQGTGGTFAQDFQQLVNYVFVQFVARCSSAPETSAKVPSNHSQVCS